MEQGTPAAPAGTLGEAVGAARAAIAARRAADHQLHRAVARVERAGAAAAGGYRSTAALLGDALRVNATEAKRLVTRAEQLVEHCTPSGEVLEPPMPASAAASRDGVVDEGHLAVIADTLTHLRDVPGLDADALTAAEASLAQHAATLSPAGLRTVALRLVATLDPDGAAPEEEPEPVDEAQLIRRRDGSLALTLRLHGPADAEVVVEVFDALGTPAGPDDLRSRAQRDAEVFKELCAQAVSPTGIATDTRNHQHDHDQPGGDTTDGEPDGDDPSDHEPADSNAAASKPINSDPIDSGAAEGAPSDGSDPPGSGPGSQDGQRGVRAGRRDRAAGTCGRITVAGRALLALTIDHRWLQRQVGHALLDSGHAVSPATARRLACDAGIVPTILGTRGEPLDVGRMSYTVPEALRRALHHRDGGCSFPGCTRRPKRCHAHHIDHWIDGGPTRLENTTLLCLTHHHLVHHGGWTVTIIDGRPWWWPPIWIDPHQQPRPGGRFPIPDQAPRPERLTTTRDPRTRSTPSSGRSLAPTTA